jgi:hypothetical protein
MVESDHEWELVELLAETFTSALYMQLARWERL